MKGLAGPSFVEQNETSTAYEPHAKLLNACRLDFEIDIYVGRSLRCALSPVTRNLEGFARVGSYVKRHQIGPTLVSTSHVS